jgi:hypothetical protein
MATRVPGEGGRRSKQNRGVSRRLPIEIVEATPPRVSILGGHTNDATTITKKLRRDQ